MSEFLSKVLSLAQQGNQPQKIVLQVEVQQSRRWYLFVFALWAASAALFVAKDFILSALWGFFF